VERINVKVYLLRHGEIEQGAEKRLVGQTDLPLTDNGKRQILWWRDTLANIAFRRVYCSDLVRSRQSAEILASGATRSVTVLPQLREINLGQWEGMAAEELKARFAAQWEERGADLPGWRPPGGESFGDLADRVIPIFESITAESGDDFVVVGHAGVNRVILCHVLGTPINNIFRLRQDYGALNIIECARKTRQVWLMNFTPEKEWSQTW